MTEPGIHDRLDRLWKKLVRSRYVERQNTWAVHLDVPSSHQLRSESAAFEEMQLIFMLSDVDAKLKKMIASLPPIVGRRSAGEATWRGLPIVVEYLFIRPALNVGQAEVISETDRTYLRQIAISYVTRAGRRMWLDDESTAPEWRMGGEF